MVSHFIWLYERSNLLFFSLMGLNVVELKAESRKLKAKKSNLFYAILLLVFRSSLLNNINFEL